MAVGTTFMRLCPPDGFGFLIPEKEEKSFLGAIWSSVIFPNRTDETKAAFTLFIGGSRDAGFVDDVEHMVFDRARREFELIMKISAEPVLISKRLWPKAKPQYNLGYVSTKISSIILKRTIKD